MACARKKTMTQTLGHPIAIGRTAEIFLQSDGQVLKLYRDWCPPDWVEYELKIGRIVQDAGLPVPAVGNIVDVNNRRGIIYERIDGISMLDEFKRKLWTIRKQARTFAELHAAIHNCAVPIDLPSQHNGFARSITNAPNLPPDLRDAVLFRLDALPDDDQLCHGDFHPGNVMLTARGPIVIDWMTAQRGNPIADVARTLMLLTIGTPPSNLERILVKFARGAFVETYLEHYFKLRPGNRDQVETWKPIIAAARLNENINGERAALIGMIRAGLKQ
jgi:tRNA A-37 threonylcarbamoyl transferase component Bud32